MRTIPMQFQGILSIHSYPFIFSPGKKHPATPASRPDIPSAGSASNERMPCYCIVMHTSSGSFAYGSG